MKRFNKKQRKKIKVDKIWKKKYKKMEAFMDKFMIKHWYHFNKDMLN